MPLGERVSEDHACGDVGHRYARRFRQERYRTRRTRVDLDDVDLVVVVADELYVVESDDADLQTQFDRIVDDLVTHGLADAEGGVDADTVARVDTGLLDMLHDSGYEYLPAVADGVDFELLAHDVLVHQHGRVLVDLDGRVHVVAQGLLVADDLHGAAAQHVTRTYQYGVTYACGSLHSVLDRGYGLGLRLRYPQLLHDALETAAVLGVAYGHDVGADDRHVEFGQRLGQVDGCLSAERDNYALRFFETYDVHHIFDRQGLEIEFVAGGVVRRYGFGIVVYDDRLVSGLAYGPYGVYGRVVELDALSDTYRARTEDHDLLAVADNRLVLLLVGTSRTRWRTCRSSCRRGICSTSRAGGTSHAR